MRIADREVGPGKPSYLIAEVGNCHGGDMKTAYKLIDAAADSGADAVKTQVRDIDRLYTKAFLDTPYNSEHAYGPTYGLHRKKLELGPDDLYRLKEHARNRGIHFFATAFDPWSLETCLTLDFPAIKFASGDLTNHALLEQGARSGVPLLVSTGGHGFSDVEAAWNVVEGAGAASRTALLQCTAQYPCAWENLNLNVVVTLQKAFGCVVGASLHDNGIAMAVASVTLGASIIERHFTLDRTMKGSDHALALEPQGFKKMVRDIRRLEVALGTGVKKALDCERSAMQKLSKACYAKSFLPAGHVLTADDVIIRSPADGLPPSALPSVIGRRLCLPIGPEEPIREERLVAEADRTRLASA